MYEFPVETPLSVDLRVASGSCSITAEECDTATVLVEPVKPDDERARQAAAETVVQLTGDELVIKTPETNGIGWLFGRRTAALRITVRIPLDSALDAKVASAEVRCGGRLRALSVTNASGDVIADHVTGDTTINTASGDIQVSRVDGTVKAKSASGDLRVDYVGGGVSHNSASGDTTLGTTLGGVKIHAASGDIRIGAARSGSVKVTTASGDVSVGVPAGTGVWLDLNTASGTTTSDLTMSGDRPTATHDLELRVSTASGDVEVHRVPAVDPEPA